MGKEERTVRMFVAVVYNLRTVIAFCNETADRLCRVTSCATSRLNATT